MSRFGRWKMAVTAALCLGSEAFATTLVTGAVRVEPDEIVVCTALNVGVDAEAGLQVELLAAQPSAPVSLRKFECLSKNPGDVCDVGFQNDGGSTFVFCKVTSSNKRTVRGVIQNVATGASLEAR